MRCLRSGEDAGMLHGAVNRISSEGMVPPSPLIQAFCLLVSPFFLNFLSQLPSLPFIGDKHRCAAGPVLWEQRQAE